MSMTDCGGRSKGGRRSSTERVRIFPNKAAERGVLRVNGPPPPCELQLGRSSRLLSGHGLLIPRSNVTLTRSTPTHAQMAGTSMPPPSNPSPSAGRRERRRRQRPTSALHHPSSSSMRLALLVAACVGWTASRSCVQAFVGPAAPLKTGSRRASGFVQVRMSALLGR
jgi:hypothetical protein